MAPIPKRKTARAPPVDKLLKPAIGIGLALLAYQFFKGLDKEIIRMDPTDELVLRDVLFGEGSTKTSYAVLCHKETDPILSSVFQDAANDGSAPVEFRLLDCDYELPASKKTIADRFKLNLKQRPTVFVSGHVGPPKQIPSKHLKTGKMLVKLLRNMLEPRAAKVETTQDLRTKCLSKDYCGLLLKGSKTVSGTIKTAMANLVSQHPKVAFASVDTSVLFVKNLEEYLPEFREGVPRFVVFKRVSGGLDTGADRLVTSIAPLSGSSKIGYGPMNTLVQSVVDGGAVQKIPALPMIKTRTKKLVEEERAKRQRKEQRESQEQQKTPEGEFTINDGSREGRRAERERRRAEHYAEHNIKPKTPEEIQEMERKRRIRMEQEAEKWNMAPEDADGDVMEEGDEGEEFYDEGEDEDEEVMDLD